MPPAGAGPATQGKRSSVVIGLLQIGPKKRRRRVDKGRGASDAALAQLRSLETHARQHSWQPPCPQGDTHHFVSGVRSSRQIGQEESPAPSPAPPSSAAAAAASLPELESSRKR